MENALLNLAINAGQAMPGGGELIVDLSNQTVDARTAGDTADAESGDYVAIAVTDTGTGMGPEVSGRAFDPFFTTKPVGEGSGLGLSMVYGFARQSGGFATIESEPGRGTTVRLYLPRIQAEAKISEIEPPPEAPRAKGEIVLVVEDDPEIRVLSVDLLESLGYEVLSAPEGARARDSRCRAQDRSDAVRRHAAGRALGSGVG